MDNTSTLTREDLLNALSSLTEDDMLKLSAAQATIMKQKEIDRRRKKAEKAHKYKIGYSPAQDRYYTRHPEDYKKKIFRKSKEELLDFLFSYYFPEELLQEETTLDSLFAEWLEFKTTITDSPNTISTLEKHYHRYFEGSDLFRKPIKEITVKDLNLWANQLIRDNSLSSKQWQTIKTIPKQIFEFAMDDGLIDTNPFPSLRVTVKFRQIAKKKSEEEVFNTEEFEFLVKDLTASFEKTHHVRFIAVLWNFFVGLRAGEISGLMWNDVDLRNRQITIRREIILVERKRLDSGIYKESIDNGSYSIFPRQEGKKWVYVMVDHTKVHKERIIDLPEEAVKILREIPKASIYVFADKTGKILTLRQINSVLEDACVHLAQSRGVQGTVAELRKTVKIKRSHKIRKTYASTLSAAGFPIDRIREYLGHSSLQTTLGYIYDPLSDAERRNLLENAFGNGNIPHRGMHPKTDEKHPKIGVR